MANFSEEFQVMGKFSSFYLNATHCMFSVAIEKWTIESDGTAFIEEGERLETSRSWFELLINIPPFPYSWTDTYPSIWYYPALFIVSADFYDDCDSVQEYNMNVLGKPFFSWFGIVLIFAIRWWRSWDNEDFSGFGSTHTLCYTL